MNQPLLTQELFSQLQGAPLQQLSRQLGTDTTQTGNAVYEQLVGLLLSIRDCHHRLGTPDTFRTYITALRASQRRKRNLMRLMDEHGL